MREASSNYSITVAVQMQKNGDKIRDQVWKRCQLTRQIDSCVIGQRILKKTLFSGVSYSIKNITQK